MQLYVNIDDEGYVNSASSTPIKPGLPDPVEAPDDFRGEYVAAYKLIDDALIFDTERAAEMDAAQAEYERQQAEIENAQAALRRIQIEAAARLASDEDALLLASLIPELDSNETADPDNTEEEYSIEDENEPEPDEVLTDTI